MMPDNDNKKGLTREFLAERDVRIFKMRQAGVPITEISRRFGISGSTVASSIRRQLSKLSQEAMMAYPQVLQMELERLDALQSAIWPMTQHRKIQDTDGNELTTEPDIKAVQTALSILDRRMKLLGMEQNNVNVSMQVSGDQPIRATLAGAAQVAGGADKFDPESEARRLLELMELSGVLPANSISSLLGDSAMLTTGGTNIDDLSDEVEDEQTYE